MTTPFFRTEHNYDRKEASDATATINNEGSLTRQEFAADADINTIVERMSLGYQMPVNTTPPMQGDFTGLPDYGGAVQMIRKAQEIFNNLPAKIRERFQNDPEKYINFFHDENNRLEAEKLGLVKPRPVPEDPAKKEPALKEPAKTA